MNVLIVRCPSGKIRAFGLCTQIRLCTMSANSMANKVRLEAKITLVFTWL